MLINLSNHSSSNWTDEQLQACAAFGEVVDMPFPNVDPSCDEAEIARLADETYGRILATADVQAVHVMGEYTLTFAIVSRLLKAGFRCLTSTTERISRELPDGQILKTFRFVRLREYRVS